MRLPFNPRAGRHETIKQASNVVRFITTSQDLAKLRPSLWLRELISPASVICCWALHSWVLLLQDTAWSQPSSTCVIPDQHSGEPDPNFYWLFRQSATWQENLDSKHESRFLKHEGFTGNSNWKAEIETKKAQYHITNSPSHLVPFTAILISMHWSLIIFCLD